MKVGSSTENCGYTFSEANASFLPISLRLTTEFMFISEPVAGSVRTVPKGRASFTGSPFSSMSHGSLPLYTAAAAMNLQASITDPPPSAIMKSSFLSRASFTAFMQVAYSGFGSIPPNSTNLRLPMAATVWS